MTSWVMTLLYVMSLWYMYVAANVGATSCGESIAALDNGMEWIPCVGEGTAESAGMAYHGENCGDGEIETATPHVGMEGALSLESVDSQLKATMMR